MQSKIIIFCGKGGVGKTTLALGMALRCAESGRRVVVVSSHPLDELAVAVSLEGMAERFPVAARNLFVVHIEPRDRLAELVRNHFPSRMIADAVLASKVYQNLVEVAPGLKEVQFLARLQQLAEKTGKSAPHYDLLLWDAPSTGHFLSTLHAARHFETFLSGPLAVAGAELARFFSNTDRITLLPVTTLEEMAVAETIEMCDKLKTEFDLEPATVLLNMVSPLATALDKEIDTLRGASDAALRFALDRGLIERERAGYLKKKLPVDQTPVERLRGAANDLDLLSEVGPSLERICVNFA